MTDELDNEKEEISLRDEIENTLKEVRERESEPSIKQSEEKEPVSEKDKNEEEKVEKPSESAVPSVPADAKPSQSEKTVNPPNAWTAAAKAKWDGLDPELKAEIAKREAEVHEGFTRFDEERSVGKTFKEVVSPYAAMIAAEGGTPITAVKELLNTAYLLRTATPQAKGQLILQLAQQFGADLQSASSQSQNPIDPQLQAIQQELASLKNARQQEIAMREQQERASIQSQIDAFAADPKNVYFESVKAEMAALLQGKRAKDLQEAYDMAVWARPDIRSTLIQAQEAEKEAKRLAETKAKAEAARKAGSSITGSPGATAPVKSANKELSLREELEQQFAALRG